MSKLLFDGINHAVELIDHDGKSMGKWTAFNNIDSAYARKHYGGLTHLGNGVYPVQDPHHPHKHAGDSANGSFGSYGIIRFNYPGHPGVGLHSGRANDRCVPGARHATHGCIRTTDEAMAAIGRYMIKDPISAITVHGNSQASAQHGHARHGQLIGSP